MCKNDTFYHLYTTNINIYTYNLASKLKLMCIYSLFYKNTCTFVLYKY